ncbi:hypothetical protein [Paenibacillus alba]|uniref:Uncharacterized protein n=1 Tax=Paenibacillus alba TaxID=1197127 RepID=A0ABU6FWF4_9BACL|nr:hypothetical protein [Paenibacillus alba]MEC0226235.1 hypothetical protein [Paenibacillus alba]
MFERTKKGLSSLLAAVLVFGTVFMAAVPNAVYADEPGFAGGAGSESDPYAIQTADQLNLGYVIC